MRRQSAGEQSAAPHLPPPKACPSRHHFVLFKTWPKTLFRTSKCPRRSLLALSGPQSGGGGGGGGEWESTFQFQPYIETQILLKHRARNCKGKAGATPSLWEFLQKVLKAQGKTVSWGRYGDPERPIPISGRCKSPLGLVGENSKQHWFACFIYEGMHRVCRWGELQWHCSKKNIPQEAINFFYL